MSPSRQDAGSRSLNSWGHANLNQQANLIQQETTMNPASGRDVLEYVPLTRERHTQLQGWSSGVRRRRPVFDDLEDGELPGGERHTRSPSLVRFGEDLEGTLDVFGERD